MEQISGVENKVVQGVYLTSAPLLSLASNTNKIVDGNTLEYTGSITVSTDGVYTFDYSVNLSDYQRSCNGVDLYMDCVYDLEISIKDLCGNEKILSGPFTTSIGDYQGFNFNADNPSVQSINTLNVSLTKGTYTLVKRLKVNKEVFDFYFDYYFNESNNCLIAYDDFLFAERGKIPENPCDYDCSQSACELELGADYADHLSKFSSPDQLSQQEYDYAIASCMEPCSEKKDSEMIHDMMEIDVFPGGQYAEYQVLTDGTYSASSSPLSVYNVTTKLPKGDGTLMWKKPIENGTLTDYKDKYGNISYITIRELIPGTYEPEIDLTATPTTNPVTGALMVKPSELMHFKDFILNWDPVWAKYLVEYHPEYYACLLYTSPSPRDRTHHLV